MPNVRDYIQQRLQENQDALKEAQDERSRNQGLVGMAQGLGQAVAGLSRAPNSFNAEPYKALNNVAEQPVQDQLEQQKSKSQALQEAAGEQDMQIKNESYDPTSTRSKMVKGIISKYNPKLADTEFAAADAPMITHLEGAREAAETRKEIAKGNNLFKNSLHDQKLDDDHDNGLHKNDAWKKADSTANGADALSDTVRNATVNKTALASLPTELANFASRGQRLHSATIEAFQNPNSDLMTKIQAAMQKGSKGTLPPGVANDIISYIQLEKRGAQQQKQAVERQFAEQFYQKHKRYPKSYMPQNSTQGGGWSQDEENELKALEQKLGGSNAPK